MNMQSDHTTPAFTPNAALSSCELADLSGEACPPVVGRDHQTLMRDPWIAEEEPEYGYVRLERVAIIDRNLSAIAAIARMLANGVNEPNATGGEPWNPWTVATLLGGAESLCRFSLLQTEEMRAEVHDRIGNKSKDASE